MSFRADIVTGEIEGTITLSVEEESVLFAQLNAVCKSDHNFQKINPWYVVRLRPLISLAPTNRRKSLSAVSMVSVCIR